MQLSDDLIKPNAKAIVAFVVTGVVTWAARRNIDIPEWLQIIIAGVVGYALVWITKNVPKVAGVIGDLKKNG